MMDSPCKSIIKKIAEKNLCVDRSVIKTLDSVLEPIGVNNFFYAVFEKKKRITTTYTNLEWQELILNNLAAYRDKDFLDTILVKDFDTHVSASQIFTVKNLFDVDNLVLKDMIALGCQSGVHVANYDATTDRLEVCAFFSYLPNDRGAHQLLSRLDYLHQFILFFKERMQGFIKDTSLTPAEARQYLTPQPHVTSSAITNSKPSLCFPGQIKKFYLGSPFPTDIYLTASELFYLKQSFIGKTAKEIAKESAVSFRSVEKHFEHIKAKAGCSSLHELKTKLGNCHSFLALIGIYPQLYV